MVASAVSGDSSGPAGVTVVPGVDLDRLRRWLDGAGVGTGPLEDVAPLGGGSQNVLVAFRRADRRYVLRRPPLAERPGADDTLRREARVVAALAATDVPHPRLVVACADAEPLGAAFFVSELVDGVSLWDEVPPALTGRDAQHCTGLQVAAAFGTLARVEPAVIGLVDLARPGDWLARQPTRWQRQLTSYAELDGDAGERLPGAVEVYAWLDRHAPSTWSAGLLHGDAHLGNVLVASDGSGVAALVDWELAAVGDPLLDLAQLLSTWPVPGGAYADRVDAPGLPAPGELVEEWARVSGRAVDDLPWFRVLAGYRLGVLLEGTHARARAGLAPAATGLTLHQRATGLVREAATAAGI